MESATAKPKKTPKLKLADLHEELEKNIETLTPETLIQVLETYQSVIGDTEIKKLNLLKKVRFFLNIKMYGSKDSEITSVKPEDYASYKLKRKQRIEEDTKRKNQLLDTLYVYLFPLKSSYTITEMLIDMMRDMKALDENKNQYFSHYLDHVSKEEFESMTDEQKNTFVTKLKAYRIDKHLSAEQNQKLKVLLEPNELKQQRLSIRYPRNTRKLNAFPANTNIYYYAGHGNDVCDPITKQPYEAIVPENCILITTGLCGRVTHFNDKHINFFREKTEESRRVLRYPYLKEALAELASKLTTPVSDIHIKLPGELYIVSTFYPVAEWNSDSNFIVSQSGFMEKRDMELLLNTTRTYGIYKPSIDSIISRLKNKSSGNTIQVFNDVMSFDFDTLPNWFENFPYYLQTIKERFTSAEFKEYTDKIAKEKSTLSSEELKKYLFDFVVRIQIKEFLDLFKASTLPAPHIVRNIVREYYEITYKTPFNVDAYLTPTDVREISTKLKTELTPSNPNAPPEVRNKLTTSYLMEKFPGIHYFTICRSVDSNCQQGATLRRTASNTQETERRESVGKALMNRSFNLNYNTIQSASNVESFLKKYEALISGMNTKNEFIKELQGRYTPTQTIKKYGGTRKKAMKKVKRHTRKE